ncbi:MAG: DnaJ domain-containing protein [Gammaproteobacteria bacterium]|nr:DnaJ domain-containing protein [Gammaproteobacteria bacterium]
MKNRRNFYRILHVQPDAPHEIIKASYRTLMQKLKQHPDLGGDNWNALILNEAYTVLTNPEKRAAYDQQFLHRVRKTRTQPGRQEHGREKQKQQKSANRHNYRKDNSRCPFCGTPKPVRFRYGNSGNCNHCHSPLKSVLRLGLAGKSRRALQRTSQHAPIGYFTDPGKVTGIPGITRDLSPHGMQFLTTNRLDDNQVIKIVSDILSAVARVTYCRQHNGRKQYAVGVEFLTLCFHERTGTFISENA